MNHRYASSVADEVVQPMVLPYQRAYFPDLPFSSGDRSRLQCIVAVGALVAAVLVHPVTYTDVRGQWQNALLEA
jgi:hypothetical protein